MMMMPLSCCKHSRNIVTGNKNICDFLSQVITFSGQLKNIYILYDVINNSVRSFICSAWATILRFRYRLLKLCHMIQCFSLGSCIGMCYIKITSWSWQSDNWWNIGATRQFRINVELHTWIDIYIFHETSVPSNSQQGEYELPFCKMGNCKNSHNRLIAL